MSASSKNCAGCGETLKEIGALAMLMTRCCGSLPYALCVTCADTMARGDAKQRAVLVQKIEMSLAADEEQPQ